MVHIEWILEVCKKNIIFTFFETCFNFFYFFNFTVVIQCKENNIKVDNKNLIEYKKGYMLSSHYILLNLWFLSNITFDHF